MSNLLEKIEQRSADICLYGIAPPKLITESARLEEIVHQHVSRFTDLGIDGLVVYDIQDEADRTSAPRPFPFLPTLDPQIYADNYLRAAPIPKIVYKCIPRIEREDFTRWLDQVQAEPVPRICVLVGAASNSTAVTSFKLPEAYQLAQEKAPRLIVGGIMIPERHTKNHDEHLRISAKVNHGCQFFITQAVYDVASAKSVLSDYALHSQNAQQQPLPILFTFSPCGSIKTLEFMKWLGVSLPRWLENELRHSHDILDKSVALCQRIYTELREFGMEKGIPIGFNVESVSIRKAEIDASVTLFKALKNLSIQK